MVMFLAMRPPGNTASHPELNVCRYLRCSHMSSWKVTPAVHPQHTPGLGGRIDTLLASA